MPPSPRINVCLDPIKYAELCESMEIRRAPVVTFKAHGGKVYGRYFPLTNKIEVYHGQVFFEANRLRAVNAELVDTLLHELRHAWQDQEWGIGHYAKNVVKAENDANDYAKLHYHEWRGVLSVRRQVFHSKLPG